MTLAPIRLFPHLAAIALSLAYAWHISQTDYVTTGLQFIAPLLVILLCHLAFLWLRRRLEPGYARLVLSRTLTSAVLMIVLLIASELLTPRQSYAGAGETVTSILSVLFCLVVLAIVIGIVALAVYIAYLVIAPFVRWISGGSKNDHLHDHASTLIAIALISGASLEGVPGAYTFRSDDHSVASYTVAAPPEAVWEAMQTATSPEFPLPSALDMFPKPIAVLVDEGTRLGANRVVLIRGREGQGRLHLRVTEQSGLSARFSVVSDTSPTGRWVAFKSLSYTVSSHPTGAEIAVRLDYERLLAPSWIFDPMIQTAATLAASVLAQDTKIRAEPRPPQNSS